MSEVTLDNWEIVLADSLAKQRYLQDRKNNIGGYENTTNKDKHSLEMMAICGELAFAKLCNIYFHVSQNPKERASKPDFYLSDGSTLDVKTTDYRGGKLLLKCKSYPNKHANLYALMIAEHPIYKYAGFATQEQLIQEENIIHFENGTSAFALAQNQLNKNLPNEVTHGNNNV